jgi:two-component system, LuxR family, sensor kinase FixL
VVVLGLLPPLLPAQWWLAAGVALCLAQATLIALLLVQRSRRLRAERESDEQRRALTHLARVESLGELSGGLAHELHQPLTAILANAQAAQRLLANGPADLEEVRHALDDIIDADQRACQVVESLRAMLKRTEARAQLVDLNQAIHETLALAGGDLRARGVAVSVELQARHPSVIGDRVQLQQVVLNLIFNGCDAMAALDAGERRLTIATGDDPGGSVALWVADRGTGIASASIEKIFEPFVTTKPDGLGLGLAISRTIVNTHGGRLWATNNQGPGATLHVALPPAAPSSALAARSARAH